MVINFSNIFYPGHLYSNSHFCFSKLLPKIILEEKIPPATKTISKYIYTDHVVLFSIVPYYFILLILQYYCVISLSLKNIAFPIIFLVLFYPQLIPTQMSSFWKFFTPLAIMIPLLLGTQGTFKILLVSLTVPHIQSLIN